MSQMLRLATAGSVDDGKSTLIGRLFYDCKAIFADQLKAVERASRQRGEEYTNLALLTDGLRAEREQGITIDVAYRYFATPRRKFIIADTPGHIQYTRNMVTGASTADLAMILVDARKGVLEQTRRHAFLATLLGVPHLILCVNKMDLVDWSQERYDEICREFRGFAARLDVHDISFVPISALHGDNVVNGSAVASWYDGPSLLHCLEEVHISSDPNLIDARFPVQYVIRKDGFRGCAGTIAGGVFHAGEEVVVLPSGFTSVIKEICEPGGASMSQAFSPQAVVLRLADELDVGRGDLICRPGNQPQATQDIDAMVCWLTDQSTLKPAAQYMVQHTTRTTKARVQELDYRIDVNSLHRDERADQLTLNEIGRIRLRTQQPLVLDSYRRNRYTGSFILIDEATNYTVAAGMITGRHPQADTATDRPAVLRRRGQADQGLTLWLTGPSDAVNSEIASKLELMLRAESIPTYLLTGDVLRQGINADLTFGPGDRVESVRRTAEVARVLADAGVIVVVTHGSPYRADRDLARATHDEARQAFAEVFVDATSVTSEVSGTSGTVSSYEAPEASELILRVERGDTESPARELLVGLRDLRRQLARPRWLGTTD